MINTLLPLGNLFIIAAPSGAGKSSLIGNIVSRSAALAKNQPAQIQVSVSHTTRAPRPGENDGEHYHFVDHAQFKAMADAGEFYEFAEVFGHYYGTSKAEISDKLRLGIDVFLDIDWQGARQVKRQQPDAVSIFIMPPSYEALQQRLIKRGQDDDSVITSRMSKAISEMSHYNEFDYLVINDVFDEAVAQVESVLDATRLKTQNQQIRHQSLLERIMMP